MKLIYWIKNVFKSDKRDPGYKFYFHNFSAIRIRKVNEITTEMLREEERNDKRLIYWLNKSSYMFMGFDHDSPIYKVEKTHKEERNEYYWQKHFKIHVRLSIKQTK